MHGGVSACRRWSPECARGDHAPADRARSPARAAGARATRSRRAWEVVCTSCGEKRWPLAVRKPVGYLCARCQVTSPAKRRQPGRRARATGAIAAMAGGIGAAPGNAHEQFHHEQGATVARAAAAVGDDEAAVGVREAASAGDAGVGAAA
jgi:hypothetical protein